MVAPRTVRNLALQVTTILLTLMAGAQGGPYLRSNLARAMYQRLQMDERLRTMDLAKLYQVDELALTEAVRARFVPLTPDDETRVFLDECFQQADWLVTQIWHSVAKSFLGLFMTQTSINGLLNRGRMFVWSEAQAKQLLGIHLPDGDADEAHEALHNSEGDGGHASGGTAHKDLDAEGDDEGAWSNNDDSRGGAWMGERLLDLGAGDGYVTKVLAKGAIHVDVTETSPIMRRRLRGRGYRVLDAWSWAKEAEDMEYDVITCLNLLDRCDTPRSLLTQIHSKLAPSGTLVVALVLPFSPYVETGTMDNLPSEDLGVTGTTLEAQVNILADEVFPSLGFSLVRWSRLPYLCEGDLDQAFYWLSDVVLVLKKADPSGEKKKTGGGGEDMQRRTFASGEATGDDGEECYEDALYEVKIEL